MRLVYTPQFEDDLTRIEDHIFLSTNDVKFVNKFLDEVDATILWVKSNTTIPKIEETGDRSWLFYRDNKGELRYRLTYLYQDQIKTIFLKRVIDNREQNLGLYPVHKLGTYSGDED
jgi:hypothetical protein